MTKTHYELLQVSNNSTDSDIRKSYKQLARKYHPDKNHNDPGATEIFKALQHAYEVLMDPVRRSKYNSEIGHITRFSSTPSTPNRTSTSQPSSQKKPEYPTKSSFYNARSNFFTSTQDRFTRRDGGYFRRENIFNGFGRSSSTPRKPSTHASSFRGKPKSQETPTKNQKPSSFRQNPSSSPKPSGFKNPYNESPKSSTASQSASSSKQFFGEPKENSEANDDSFPQTSQQQNTPPQRQQNPTEHKIPDNAEKVAFKMPNYNESSTSKENEPKLSEETGNNSQNHGTGYFFTVDVEYGSDDDDEPILKNGRDKRNTNRFSFYNPEPVEEDPSLKKEFVDLTLDDDESSEKQAESQTDSQTDAESLSEHKTDSEQSGEKNTSQEPEIVEIDEDTQTSHSPPPPPFDEESASKPKSRKRGINLRESNLFSTETEHIKRKKNEHVHNVDSNHINRRRLFNPRMGSWKRVSPFTQTNGNFSMPGIASVIDEELSSTKEASDTSKENETPKQSTYNFHDSLIVLEVKPPSPPNIPQSSEELGPYGNAMIAYLKAWNEYASTIALYWTERTTANSNLGYNLLYEPIHIERYFQAMRTDSIVSETYKAACETHAITLLQYAELKQQLG